MTLDLSVWLIGQEAETHGYLPTVSKHLDGGAVHEKPCSDYTVHAGERGCFSETGDPVVSADNGLTADFPKKASSGFHFYFRFDIKQVALNVRVQKVSRSERFVPEFGGFQVQALNLLDGSAA